MAFFHGVKTAEKATSIITPVQTENAVPFIVGTAPIHLATDPARVNEPVLCYQNSEFVTQFGYSADYENYTLCEAADTEFKLFSVSPAVFVNVLDPDKHFNVVEDDIGGITSANATIDSAMLLDTLEVTSSGTAVVTLTGSVQYTETVNTDSSVTVSLIVGATLPPSDLTLEYDTSSGTGITDIVPQANFPYTLPTTATNLVITGLQPFTNTLIKDTDFTAAYNSNNKVIITLLDDTKVANDTIHIKYHELDATQVTDADIIGGYDLITGRNTGFETIEDVFPKYRIVPTILVCPKYSQSPTVAAIMKAKTTKVNGVWRAIALVDIPTAEVDRYTLVPQYKTQHNLIDTSLVVCWPKVALEGVQYYLSTQLMGLCQSVNSEFNDLPFKSPSNENLQCDSMVLENGEEIKMTLENANYLNSNGIYTALNWTGGYRGWGNYSSLYPAETDVKDVFISVRRMFNYISNELVLTYWQEVDEPLNLSLVEEVVDSCNIWLNGLTAAGALLGGSISAIADENPVTDLLQGIVRFHLNITPPVPAQTIEFTLEYDTTALSALFG